jgi:hypothetical protein
MKIKTIVIRKKENRALETLGQLSEWAKTSPVLLYPAKWPHLAIAKNRALAQTVLIHPFE